MMFAARNPWGRPGRRSGARLYIVFSERAFALVTQASRACGYTRKAKDELLLFVTGKIEGLVLDDGPPTENP